MDSIASPERAFVSRFELAPTGRGALDGLRFAAKDLIDVAGHVTGAGNRAWQETHAPATQHAPCVQQLLAAGATCVGKTVTDELALSLLGENPTFGTPLNSRAPDRVPGGSSSGSASVVASGLVDFALGSDTGGSVRVPAHNCGVWGYRPTHGALSLEGVVALAPTYDTLGVFARSAAILANVGGVLLGQRAIEAAAPEKILLLADAFDIADAPVREQLQPAIAALAEKVGVRHVRLRDLVGDADDLAEWSRLYSIIQRIEAWQAHGEWVTRVQPQFGPAAEVGFALAKGTDPALLPAARQRFAELRARLRKAVGEGLLICMPTAPCLPPKLGERPRRDEPNGYYARTFAFTAIGGVAGLPQVSMPVADVGGVPIGLSLLAGAGQDAFLLGAVAGTREEMR